MATMLLPRSIQGYAETPAVPFSHYSELRKLLGIDLRLSRSRIPRATHGILINQRLDAANNI